RTDSTVMFLFVILHLPPFLILHRVVCSIIGGKSEGGLTMKATNCALLVALLMQLPAYSQTAELQLVSSVAEPLGAKSRIQALRSIIMEGAGRQPNIGQN